jgi:hypothetical protein
MAASIRGWGRKVQGSHGTGKLPLGLLKPCRSWVCLLMEKPDSGGYRQGQDRALASDQGCVLPARGPALALAALGGWLRETPRDVAWPLVSC